MRQTWPTNMAGSKQATALILLAGCNNEEIRAVKTPPLPRADGKGGVIIRGISADGDQSVVGNIVPDGATRYSLR